VAALWCKGEAIIAQVEGKSSTAELITKRLQCKNSELQAKPFIKKVRRRRTFKVQKSGIAVVVVVARSKSPPLSSTRKK